MKVRQAKTGYEQTQVVRRIIAPLAEELARLNNKVATLMALGTRAQSSDENLKGTRRQASEALSAVASLEHQLDKALAKQPTDIISHGLIADVRGTMASLKARLRDFAP